MCSAAQIWLKKKYDGALVNSQVLPYPIAPINFWQHLCAFEATIRRIREMWTLTKPMVMRGFLTFDECKALSPQAVNSFLSLLLPLPLCSCFH